MLSILLPVRNAPKHAANCLRSIIDTLDRLHLDQRAEVVLMDDDSAPAEGIPDLFRTFKQSTKSQVMAFRFKKRQHYSRACAVGLSLTQGEAILLLSHDMILTPPYLRTLLAVSALDARHGIVRGTSPRVDGFPQHQVAAPLPYRSYDDIVAFAEYVERCNGLEWVEDPRSVGDSMLIRRAVIEKIGVMDGRFFGFRGALDFGLRAQRAGFSLICAKGAWLHHAGAVAPSDQPALKQQGDALVPAPAPAQSLSESDAEYQQFRQKWDPSLPAADPGATYIDVARLRAAGPREGADFQPELEMDMDEVEVF